MMKTTFSRHTCGVLVAFSTDGVRASRFNICSTDTRFRISVKQVTLQGPEVTITEELRLFLDKPWVVPFEGVNYSKFNTVNLMSVIVINLIL